ncbi:MAG: rhodanese-like domain-containing protein [Deltaproteobacteria bacterium]|nr:rhodanese-like domain-containing protein [Deltaproteobacteria bacterium]
MPQVISRDQVQELTAKSAQLVDVLPAKQYEEMHLPGAINIPLTKLNRNTAAVLNKGEPVIVYCNDYQ